MWDNFSLVNFPSLISDYQIYIFTFRMIITFEIYKISLKFSLFQQVFLKSIEVCKFLIWNQLFSWTRKF